MAGRKFKPLPGIEQHLNKISYNFPVTVDDDRFATAISVKTGYSRDISQIIVNSFFQEIRNQIFLGNIIGLPNFGKVYISSPYVSNSTYIIPKIEMNKLLLQRINGKRK